MSGTLPESFRSPTFLRNVRQAFGPAGDQWRIRLPNLLDEVCRRWDLTPAAPFALSYNYVCPARRADGAAAVLKLGYPNRELTSEIHALRAYAGEGACRLLDADAAQGTLLLERLQPGTMLAALEDDDQATEVAAAVIERLRRPAPAEEGFLSLREWMDGLKELRPRFGGGAGPFPEEAVERVEALLRDGLIESSPPALLHGDLHHFNILLSDRGWLAIDPKGVIGPPEYETGPFLINPLGGIPEEVEGARRTRRRIAILAERLGYDRRKLWAWALCHSVLSAWWDLRKDGTGGESSRAWAEIFVAMKF
jgi:streptomycin 6-kinase